MSLWWFLWFLIPALLIVSEVWEFITHTCPDCGGCDIDQHDLYGQWCNTCRNRVKEIARDPE